MPCINFKIKLPYNLIQTRDLLSNRYACRMIVFRLLKDGKEWYFPNHHHAKVFAGEMTGLVANSISKSIFFHKISSSSYYKNAKVPIPGFIGNIESKQNTDKKSRLYIFEVRHLSL